MHLFIKMYVFYYDVVLERLSPLCLVKRLNASFRICVSCFLALFHVEC